MVSSTFACLIMHTQENGPSSYAETQSDNPLGFSVGQEMELSERHSETKAEIPNGHDDEYIPQYSSRYIWSHVVFRSLGLVVSLAGIVSLSYLVGKWHQELGQVGICFAAVSSHTAKWYLLLFSNRF